MRVFKLSSLFMLFLILTGCGSGSSSSNSVSKVTTLTTPVLDMPMAYTTGQTRSYDSIGVEVLDGSLKDDGYYQKGIARSFSRDDTTEIVTDNVSGLMWQDDADAATITKQYISDTNFALENYLDTSGDTAATYCVSLNLGGFTDWRIPNFEELLSISNKAYSDPSVEPLFQNTAPEMYWTSDMAGVASKAKRVYFYNGNKYSADKNLLSNVRCVRGTPISDTKQFTRDNTNNTITDSATNLMWQDDVIIGSYGMAGAINYCENLNLAGYEDWRLPNLNELRSISNDNSYPPIYSIFKNTEMLSYWTSTTYDIDTSIAWTVSFNSPGFNYRDKAGSLYLAYIRCVRGG